MAEITPESAQRYMVELDLFGEYGRLKHLDRRNELLRFYDEVPFVGLSFRVRHMREFLTRFASPEYEASRSVTTEKIQAAYCRALRDAADALEGITRTDTPDSSLVVRTE